ncbi:MAG TPA: prolyl oligopeptidase family serine peptidase [Puia sp.]|jgi:protease II
MRKTIAFLLLLSFFVYSCKNGPAEGAAVRDSVKQYSIEQLYNNKSIGGAAFNKDESGILATANTSGIYNLYELGIGDTLLKPLTHSVKDSYFAFDYLPGTNAYLYTADQGGNENSHIYLQRAGDTAARDLTPWPNSQSNPMGWSDNKKSLFILSNSRNPKFFDVWKIDTAGWKAALFYKNDSAWSPGIISPSERYLALTKEITTDKNELYLFDRKTNTFKRISTDEEANWQPAAIEKNDSIFYYSTNAGSEFTYLVRYNILTGKGSKFYETNWDVVDMTLSEKEKYHSISINEDGKNKVLLFDHASNKPVEFPGIKDGSVQRVLISPTEKNMMLSVGSSRSPNNIYVYNFETKALKQLTQNLNPEIDVNDLVSAEVVRFKSFDGKEIPAIYYKPLTASKDHKVPAMLWIHGGPGGQTRVGFSNDIQYLVNHGYAVLAVNNRGSSGYGKTFYKLDNRDHSNGDLKDCVWGKKWLQEQDYIDSGKIGIEGGSYGGCMVLGALAFHPEEFKVGVDLFGVANWIRTLRSIPPYWESFRKALYTEMGDPYTADSVRLKNISPLYNYEKINKPLIVFQGMNDVRVLPVESEEIVAGVKKNGVPVEYVTYPNEGHGFQKKENQITTSKRTLLFLDKYLKGS